MRDAAAGGLRWCPYACAINHVTHSLAIGRGGGTAKVGGVEFKRVKVLPGMRIIYNAKSPLYKLTPSQCCKSFMTPINASALRPRPQGTNTLYVQSNSPQLESLQILKIHNGRMQPPARVSWCWWLVAGCTREVRSARAKI